MFIIKKHYYLYIDSTKSIDLKLIKKNLNINIIYRNNSIIESIDAIIKFRKKLKARKINFYIANNLRLAKICKADGLYISAYNKKFYKHTKVIGSAHNFREINQKIKQGCEVIILSRLFKTNYAGKEDFYGPIKFNLINKKYTINLIPLGGIKNSNLLKLNLLRTEGFAFLSSVKKKPAISRRLF
jgi:thiamine monophosphate synthase